MLFMCFMNQIPTKWTTVTLLTRFIFLMRDVSCVLWMMQVNFPCDVHLVNMRSWSVTDGAVALLLHRRGLSCSFQDLPDINDCSLGGEVWLLMCNLVYHNCKERFCMYGDILKETKPTELFLTTPLFCLIFNIYGKSKDLSLVCYWQFLNSSLFVHL